MSYCRASGINTFNSIGKKGKIRKDLTNQMKINEKKLKKIEKNRFDVDELVLNPYIMEKDILMIIVVVVNVIDRARTSEKTCNW